MRRHPSGALVLLALLSACTSDPSPKSVPADLNAVTFNENLHFQTTEGTDAVVAAGQYCLVLAGTDALQFQTSDGGTITVSAKAFSHDLPVRDQFAMVIREGEDANMLFCC